MQLMRSEQTLVCRYKVEVQAVEAVLEVDVQLVEKVWKALRECHWLVVVLVDVQRVILHPTVVELGFA